MGRRKGGSLRNAYYSKPLHGDDYDDEPYDDMIVPMSDSSEEEEDNYDISYLTESPESPHIGQKIRGVVSNVFNKPYHGNNNNNVVIGDDIYHGTSISFGCCSIQFQRNLNVLHCIASCNQWCLSLVETEEGDEVDNDKREREEMNGKDKDKDKDKEELREKTSTQRRSRYNMFCNWLAHVFFLILELTRRAFITLSSQIRELSSSLRRDFRLYDQFCIGVDTGGPIIWRCLCGACTLSTFWSVVSSTYRSWTFFKWALIVSTICFILLASPITTVNANGNDLNNAREINRVIQFVIVTWTVAFSMVMIMVAMLVQQYMSLYAIEIWNPREVSERDILEEERREHTNLSYLTKNKRNLSDNIRDDSGDSDSDSDSIPVFVDFTDRVLKSQENLSRSETDYVLENEFSPSSKNTYSNNNSASGDTITTTTTTTTTTNTNVITTVST